MKNIFLNLVGGLLFAPCFVTTGLSVDVQCDGVLGNSGQQGSSLVRFGTESARGIGVAVDRFGTLWDRAGKGVLNRYASDGRLLGTYKLPQAENNYDSITIIDDTLVMLLGGRIHTLAVTAAPGATAEPSKIEARCISFATHQGRIAVATKDQILLLDPRSGDSTQVGLFDEADAVEMTTDGVVFVMKRGEMYKMAGAKGGEKGSKKDQTESRAGLGDRPQYIDGYWYGHAWHGTIKRGDTHFDPAPGVVLGGASGSFIGHLDQNSELYYGRGMAKLWDGVFAVSGIGGILQLVSWDGAKKQFTVVRRLGAVATCRGLGLDRDGNIFHHAGVWQWQDAPDAPLRYQVNPPEGLGQVVMLNDQRMIAVCNLWDKPSFIRGNLTIEVKVDRRDKSKFTVKDSVGAAAFAKPGGYTLLVMMADGATSSFNLNNEGEYVSDGSAVTLQTTRPIVAWTSMAKIGDSLLAAGDGQVIHFNRDGDQWKESNRWNSWANGADAKFGKRIHIGSDGETLVVADCDRHQVFGFAAAGGTPLWHFGKSGQAGNDLNTMDHPETITVQGDRAVVFDAGNQRLLKLRITK